MIFLPGPVGYFNGISSRYQSEKTDRLHRQPATPPPRWWSKGNIPSNARHLISGGPRSPRQGVQSGRGETGAGVGMPGTAAAAVVAAAKRQGHTHTAATHRQTSHVQSVTVSSVMCIRLFIMDLWIVLRLLSSGKPGEHFMSESFPAADLLKVQRRFTAEQNFNRTFYSDLRLFPSWLCWQCPATLSDPIMLSTTWCPTLVLVIVFFIFFSQEEFRKPQRLSHWKSEYPAHGYMFCFLKASTGLPLVMSRLDYSNILLQRTDWNVHTVSWWPHRPVVSYSNLYECVSAWCCFWLKLLFSNVWKWIERGHIRRGGQNKG